MQICTIILSAGRISLYRKLLLRECADAKKFEEFKRKNESQLALDGGDNLAYIATSMVNLRLAQERYPDVQFHQTREH